MTIPAGTIVAYPGTKAPTGWAACDGGSFDVNVYAELFDLLGANTVPNLLGQFLRGLDLSGKVDPGRTILSNQADQVGPHAHAYLAPGWQDGNPGFSGGGNKPTVDTTQPPGGNETRPVNVAVLYIIYLGPEAPTGR